MTDNNYKLTLIFYKSNKASYINVTAIFSDKKTNQSRKRSHLNITVNIRYQIKQLLSRTTGAFLKYFKTKKRSGA